MSKKKHFTGGGKQYLIYILLTLFLFTACTNRYVIWWPPVNLGPGDKEPLTEDVWDGSVADYSVILNQIDSGEVRIKSAAEFAAFRDIVNGQNGNSPNNFAGIDVLLEIDLDMTYQDWDPIGTAESEDGFNISIAPFSGTFNGNNHTIKYKYDGTGEDLISYGLFNATSSSTTPVIIKNLKIEANVKIPSAYSGAGLIVGMSTGEIQFENCHVLPGSSLSINDGIWANAAGFVGTAEGVASFESCTNGADIMSATGYAGGLIGEFRTANTNPEIACILQDCHNTGNITGSEQYGYAGGIAGGVDKTSGDGAIRFIDCTNEGAIKGKYAGGIVGSSRLGLVDEIKNCSGGTSQIEGIVSSGRLVGRLHSTSRSDVSVISIDDNNGDSYNSISTIGLLESYNDTLLITSGTFHGIPQVSDTGAGEWILTISQDANWIGNGVPENPSGKTFVLSPGEEGVTITEKPESGAP